MRREFRKSIVSRVDFHVLATLIFRSWNIIAGIAMLVIIPLFMSKDDQGYYFTFASLVALQVFFELGLNQVVVQIVAHDRAHLQFEQGQLLGDKYQLNRLLSLVLILRRWYLRIAVLFAILVGAAGFLFFYINSTSQLISWQLPWVALVGCSAFNLYFSVWLAFLEGCQHVGQVARLRLAQSIVGYSSMWLALACGAGLYAVPLVPAAAALCTALWLAKTNNELSWLFKQKIQDGFGSSVIRWREEIFPLQWRIALSWMSGYLIFQLFTPATFSHYGATEAGRIGLSLSIFTAITALGMSWVAAKIPIFSGYIARNDRSQLDTEFNKVAFYSSGSIVILSVFFVITIELSKLFPQTEFIAARVANLNVLVILAVATCVNSKIFADAIYMRAHKEEPMLALSLVSAVLISGGLWFFLGLGLAYAMGFYALVTISITLPWTILLKKSYERGSRGVREL
jgi:hypothetical protein